MCDTFFCCGVLPVIELTDFTLTGWGKIFFTSRDVSIYTVSLEISVLATLTRNRDAFIVLHKVSWNAFFTFVGQIIESFAKSNSFITEVIGQIIS